jgi:hypothetical protein
MLIAAIFASIVLVIIITTINYFEGLKHNLCERKIKEALVSAANIPSDTQFITVEECTLGEEQSFNSKQLGSIVNLKPECINFEVARFLQGAINTSSDNAVSFKQSIQTSVFVQCKPNTAAAVNCDIQCTIFFGKPP